MAFLLSLVLLSLNLTSSDCYVKVSLVCIVGVACGEMSASLASETRGACNVLARAMNMSWAWLAGTIGFYFNMTVG